MKLSLFFFIIILFQVQANTGYSQTEIKLNVNEQSLHEVFDIIESQSEYRFFYKNGEIDLNQKITIRSENENITNVLDKLFNEKKQIIYMVKDKQIVLKKNNLDSSFFSRLFSTQSIITGQVTDKNGIAMMGVTVRIQDSNIGVATDVNGKYSINAENGDTLVFTYLGFEPYAIEIRGRTEIDVQLTMKTNDLNEVLLVGYGTTQKRDLTGSVGSVKSDEIEQVETQTIDQALVGRVSGVYVNAQAGGPGSGAIVNIRGLSQLIGDNQPLYVVDGVPIVINPQFSDETGLGRFGNRENPLLSINPSDIERVDILKDASAAAIYGSRAANGVVLITTKRGKRNSPTRFNFSYKSTFQNPLNTYDVLNADEWKDFVSKQGLDELNEGFEFGDANTDWQEAITNENALWNQYAFSMNGGNEKINFYASARASNQEGLMVGNSFKRYNATANIDANASDKFKIGLNLSYNYSINDQSGLTSLASGAFYRPDLPIFAEDGSYTFTLDPNYGFPVRNPLGGRANIKDEAIGQNLIGSIYGQYEILEGLTAKSQLSINLNNDNTSVFTPSYTSNAQISQLFYGTNGALLNIYHTAGVNTTWANTLNYKKVFDNLHHIDAVVGGSWDHQRLDLDYQRYNSFPDDENLTNINNAGGVTAYSSDSNENVLNSVFGRFNYNYDNKYLVTFTGRYDGSIKFGPDNQYGFFPSGALAWNVHNEGFLDPVDFINQMKLRASWGRTGSDNLPSFSYLPTYSSLGNNDSSYDGINGIVVAGVPNSAIRWEETDQLDFGLEYVLFDSRITGEIAYFKKKTSDIILLVPIPSQTGSQSWNANVADVTNKGLEFTLGADIIRNNNLRWNSSFNISFIKNRVDDLRGGSISSSGNRGVVEGEPFGVIMGYDIVNIAQNQEEINNLNANAPDGNYDPYLSQPGDYIRRDLDGDGEITSDDQKILGDINPDYFGGWNNAISYRNFDFNFNFNFVQGNDKYWNQSLSEFGSRTAAKNFLRTTVEDTWTPDNTNAEFARYGSSSHYVASSKNVFNAGYIKLRSASIAYNIPQRFYESFGIKNINVSLTGNNLFVITDYPGLDPENIGSLRGGTSIDLINGDQGSSYPQIRSFTFAVNLSL